MKKIIVFIIIILSFILGFYLANRHQTVCECDNYEYKYYETAATLEACDQAFREYIAQHRMSNE